jgi:hypothetical protein
MKLRYARLATPLVCGLLLPFMAAAQSIPGGAAKAVPGPEALEPGVDTSKSVPAPASTAAQEPQAPRATQAAPAAPAATAAAAPAPAKGAPAVQGKGAGKKGPDRLELEATDVTGNSELPKVLYIVPWKPSELGDMAGRPVHSLLDDVLQPLDRDVFRRENRYYEALTPDAAAPKGDAALGSDAKH